MTKLFYYFLLLEDFKDRYKVFLGEVYIQLNKLL